MQDITKKRLRQYIQNFFYPHIVRGPEQYEVTFRCLQDMAEYALSEAIPAEDIVEVENRVTTANFRLLDEIGFDQSRYMFHPIDGNTLYEMNGDLFAKVQEYSLNHDLKTMFYNMVTKTEWKEDSITGIIFRISFSENKDEEEPEETD